MKRVRRRRGPMAEIAAVLTEAAAVGVMVEGAEEAGAEAEDAAAIAETVTVAIPAGDDDKSRE